VTKGNNGRDSTNYSPTIISLSVLIEYAIVQLISPMTKEKGSWKMPNQQASINLKKMRRGKTFHLLWNLD
jgi:hypothetical protein